MRAPREPLPVVVERALVAAEQVARRVEFAERRLASSPLKRYVLTQRRFVRRPRAVRRGTYGLV